MRHIKKHQETGVEPEQNALQRLHKGDLDALGFLYDSYVDILLNVGVQYSRDDSWIEDQIHDLFLDLYRARHTVLDIRNLKGYLITSLKRRLFKKNKSEILIEEEKFHSMLLMDTDQTESSFESKWIDSERIEGLKLSLKSALASLTLHQQSAIHLRFVENKSYEEIAEHLAVSSASVRTLLYRSIKILRKKYNTSFSN